MLPSYPKIRNLGHRDTLGIFDGPVVVQEKVDGLQISFGVVDGELFVRSKGTHRDLEDGGMFSQAIAAIKKREDKLPADTIFRGEYLRRPRHNVVTYDRIPKGHIALFDVEYEGERHRTASTAAGFLDFDAVPVLYVGEIEGEEHLESLIPEESFLGGMCEGVVVKNYRTGQMAKVVRDEFREKHTSKKVSRPKKGVASIVETYRTEARWQKAVQHLREEDKLVGEPRDIGPLIKEIQRDVFEEYADEIKAALFEEARGQIASGLVAGFADWYKDQIAVNPFVKSE